MASKWDKFIDEWIGLYESGLTYREIGEKYSVDIGTISKQIGSKRRQIVLNKKQELATTLVELSNKHDLTYDDVSAVVGVAKSAICNLIKEKKIPYSEKMKARYGEAWVRLYRDGYSIKEIGKMFQFDSDIISAVVKESGEKVSSNREKYASLVPIWNRMYEFGFTQYEIDEIFGVGQGTIKRYLKIYSDTKRSRGEKRSPEQIQSIRNFINLVTGSGNSGKNS